MARCLFTRQLPSCRGGLRLLLMATVLLLLLPQGSSALFLCSFKVGHAQQCTFAKDTPCTEMEANKCTFEPGSKIFVSVRDVGDGRFHAVSYFDASCKILVPNLKFPLVHPGECGASIYENVTVLEMKVFTKDNVQDCPKCIGAAPTTVSPLSSYWVCAHSSAGCDLQQPMVCTKPVEGDCTTMALPTPGKFRSIGFQIDPPSDTQSLPRLSLLNPKYETFQACVFPLYHSQWNSSLPFRDGQCLRYDPPASLAPLQPMYMSVQTGDCPECASSTVAVTGKEGRHCAGLRIEQCLLEPNCHWQRTQGFGCMDFAEFTLALSTPISCSLASNVVCLEEFDYMCELTVDGKCRALQATDLTNTNPVYYWGAEDLDVETLAFANQPPVGGAPLLQAKMSLAHPCDALAAADRRLGVQFRGWERMELAPDECRTFNLTGLAEYILWTNPLAEHEIDVEGDDLGGFSGQHFLLAPPLDTSSLAENQLALGISIGTNGVSIYGFNEKLGVAKCLLVWLAPAPLSWSYLTVAVAADELRLYVNTVNEATRAVLPGMSYLMCASNIGWSPHGGYVGLLYSMWYLRPTLETVGGTSFTTLGSSTCSVQMNGLSVTAKAPFEAQAIIADSAAGNNQGAVDLGNHTVVFSIKDAPSGLSVDAATGVLSGVFDEAGEYTFLLEATTTDPTCTPAGVAVTIVALPAVSVSQVDLQRLDRSFTAGSPYSSGAPSPIVGGSGTYTVTYRNLPKGLVYDRTTGAISGRSDEFGIFLVGLTVQDTNGGQDLLNFTLTVHPPLSLVAVPESATEGSYYSRPPPPIAGGNLPYTFRLFSEDDDIISESVYGLSLDPQTGVLSGTPKLPTNVNRSRRAMLSLSIMIEDAQGSSAFEQIELSFAPPLVVVAQPIADPIELLAQQSIEQVATEPALLAQGGQEPLTYFLKRSPLGLTISQTGEIGGALKPGEYTFQVGIRDANGAEAVGKPVALSVRAADSDEVLTAPAQTAIIACAMLLVIVIVFAAWRQMRRKAHDFVKEQEILEQLGYFEGELTHPEEIPHRQLHVLENIGRGAYGSVYKAFYNPPGGPKRLVAVKQLHREAAIDLREELRHEALLTAQLNHPHIVGLVGVVTTINAEMMVLAYMEHGSLRSYLEKSVGVSELSTQTRLLVASDICAGMLFLEEHGIVHRDLAARNVLVGSDHRCAVSDFGRARHLDDSEYYRSRSMVLPVRWMAPEALQHQKYTVKSDVFSFAITLIEVWTNGCLPWKGMTNGEVYHWVTVGGRMNRPDCVPPVLYRFLEQCWAHNPDKRPSFKAVQRWLDRQRVKK